MEYKVRLQGDDGKEYVISYRDLRAKLGVDESIDFWTQRILKIEDEIVNSLEPKAQEQILKIIEENPNIRTGDLTDHFTVANRLMHLAFWHAWDKLQKSGEIVATSHGAGHHRTWNIKEA